MRILYIDIDSLRPDHLGCYGYARKTSPHIDQVASQGVCFDNCYASDMPCMPSRTSLFSGQLGIHHGCVAHTGTRAEPFPEGINRAFRSDWGRRNWMRQLRQAGMRTVTFSSFAERHAAWHWYAGFEEIHDTGHFGHELCDDVIPSSLNWLKHNARDENWFMHVNLWDVHVPYRTPAEYGLRFADTPLPDPWLTADRLQEHARQPGMRTPNNALFLQHAGKRPDLNPGQLATLEDVKQMHDAYDTAIAYVDDHIGRLLNELEAAGVLEETAIIIGADHGECLGELNAYGGHCFADHSVGHIPLIVRWPGVTTGRENTRVSSLHYHIDLAPTVCELLGIGIPDSWDARSMVKAMHGDRQVEDGRDYLVLSQMAQACQRAVRFSMDDTEFLYIRTYRGGTYALPEHLLYNLKEDPHELVDLAETHPERLHFAQNRLEEWHREMLAGRPHGDPMETVLGEPFRN